MKWVVVADDLSGAAELGAAARSSGGRVALTQGQVPSTAWDVWVIDTDSRDRPVAESLPRVEAAAQAILSLGLPRWDGSLHRGTEPSLRVFKKIDSVMRGWVGAETECLARALGADRIVLAAGNPSRHRLVRDGRLSVDGVPLHLSPFRHDPHFPALDDRVHVAWARSGGEGTPPCSILRDNSTSALRSAAATLRPPELPAGALDFFRACWSHGPAAPVLPGGACRPLQVPRQPSDHAWMVCGSRVSWPDREGVFCGAGLPVLTPLLSPSAGIPPSKTDHSIAPKAHLVPFLDSPPSCLLIGLGRDELGSGSAATESLAEWVAHFLLPNPPHWLALEGGGTAAAVLQALGWSDLEVIEEVAPGTALLHPVGQSCRVLVKPGSYPWPESVWRCFLG